MKSAATHFAREGDSERNYRMFVHDYDENRVPAGDGGMHGKKRGTIADGNRSCGNGKLRDLRA